MKKKDKKKTKVRTVYGTVCDDVVLSLHDTWEEAMSAADSEFFAIVSELIGPFRDATAARVKSLPPWLRESVKMRFGRRRRKIDLTRLGHDAIVQHEETGDEYVLARPTFR